MRIALAALLLPLAGCPEAKDPAPPAAGGDVAAPPAGEPAPAPPAGDGATTPPPGGDAAALSSTPAVPAGFASLIGSGKTVTLSGTVKGQTAAQVDFTHLVERYGKQLPEVIDTVKVTDGTFSVSVPATYDKGIYVSAVVDKKGDGPSDDDLSGGSAKPIKLAGKDEKIEITVGSGDAWMKDLPWYDPSAPAVGPKDAGGSLGVGPSGPPPEGGGTPPAVPEGAPPVGGAAPAAPAAPN